MHIATKEHGGNVAKQGAVSHNFDRKGEFKLPKSIMAEDELFTRAIEAGADDVVVEADQYVIYTTVEDFISVKENLENSGLKSEESGLAMIPRSLIEVSEEMANQNISLIEYLEDLEDVDTVYHNMKV